MKYIVASLLFVPTLAAGCGKSRSTDRFLLDLPDDLTSKDAIFVIDGVESKPGDLLLDLPAGATKAGTAYQLRVPTPCGYHVIESKVPALRFSDQGVMSIALERGRGPRRTSLYVDPAIAGSKFTVDKTEIDLSKTNESAGVVTLADVRCAPHIEIDGVAVAWPPVAPSKSGKSEEAILLVRSEEDCFLDNEAAYGKTDSPPRHKVLRGARAYRLEDESYIHAFTPVSAKSGAGYKFGFLSRCEGPDIK